MSSIGNIPPRKPGFGSRSPRFSEERKKSSPGPGTYTPNDQATRSRVKGGSFSQAERFLNDNTRHHVLRNDQGFSRVFQKMQSKYIYKPTTLSDGRNVMILGGLKRDVTLFNKLFRSYSDSHLNECVSKQNELLKEVNDELKLLLCNVDLETDEFASKEVAVILILHQILQRTQETIESKGKPSNPLCTENNNLIGLLEGRYTTLSDTISVQFDGNPENLSRMTKAMMENSDQLQTKNFVIKDNGLDTPLLKKTHSHLHHAVFPGPQLPISYDIFKKIIDSIS